MDDATKLRWRLMMKNMLLCLTLLGLALSACGPAEDAADELQATFIALAIQQTALAEAAEASETPADSPTETPTELSPTETSPPTEAPATNAPPTDEPESTDTPYQVPDWPLVRSGNSGPLVYAVQYLLRAHGYNLTVDGQFGPQTRSRVISFQTAKGLSTDGIVGPQTWAELIQGNQVREGNSGPVVRAVQRLLHDLRGYDNVAIDGDFGPIMDAAVRDFQESFDLDVDGIVGPNTWKALIAIDPLS